ncbi:MAG: hypothetical protein ACOYN2_06135 [Patescibacteria group bacterium]
MLESRFFARVEKAKAENSTKISNTSVERFKELAELYEHNKNPQAELYRSDILSLEEIVSRVLLYTGL